MQSRRRPFDIDRAVQCRAGDVSAGKLMIKCTLHVAHGASRFLWQDHLHRQKVITWLVQQIRIAGVYFTPRIVLS
jgi:hypothetical protein